MAYQENQTQNVRDLIKNHQEAIDHIYGKLDQARGTISKLQQALEEAKKESREKIASLVKRMQNKWKHLSTNSNPKVPVCHCINNLMINESLHKHQGSEIRCSQEISSISWQNVGD